MFDVSTVGYLGWIISVVIIFEILIWIRSRRPSDLPPGPTTLPIVGNLHNLDSQNFLQNIRDLRKKYGDIISLSLGNFWVIFINGSENLRELLVKRGDVTSDRPPLFVTKLTKFKGIIAASGYGWKHQRTFALSKLRDFGFGKKSFESSIHEEIEAYLDLIDRYKGHPFDLSGIIQTSMSNNIMAITVGRRFDYDDVHFKYFVDLLERNIKDKAFNGILNFAPFLQYLPGDLFGGKRIQKAMDEILAFFNKEIEEHERTLDENNPRDFIDVYLTEMKQNKTKEDVYTVEELLVVISNLFAAGTETSTTTIRWALIYLVRNMDIQRRMWKEIDDVVGCGRLPQMSDKPNLPYCEAVVLESLRLGNIVPLSLPHMASEDIFYKGYKIPKGAVLIPCLDSVAYDESLFPNSEEFKPERWIDNDNKVFGHDKALTFSLGRRVCLGESLARMELFLYLTALVQRFEFFTPEGEKPPEIKGCFGVTYSPDPFKIRAVHRK